MKLLVSVSSADEAREAVEGGADIIDAKDPTRGALGPVRADVFAEIRRAVDDDRPVTAALGEAGEGADIEGLARELVTRGARLVKVGLAGLRDAASVETALRRVVRSCASVTEASGVVAVGYADAPPGDPISLAPLVELAASAGVRGVLVDTLDKHGPSLTSLWSAAELAEWVALAHANGLFAAVAGKLRADDLLAACNAGADIVGVRGAACLGGRLGRVSRDRVRELKVEVGRRDDRTREPGRKSA